MKPGRELDKAVAEAIGYSDFWQDSQTGEWYGMHPNHINLEDDRIPIPQFSTDAYAAMELIEQFRLVVRPVWRGEGWVVGRFASLFGGNPNNWVEVIGEATGETVPHAIALAALKAG